MLKEPCKCPKGEAASPCSGWARYQAQDVLPPARRAPGTFSWNKAARETHHHPHQREFSLAKGCTPGFSHAGCEFPMPMLHTRTRHRLQFTFSFECEGGTALLLDQTLRVVSFRRAPVTRKGAQGSSVLLGGFYLGCRNGRL